MTDEQATMLVETNTMVKMIYAQLPKLASTDRVDAIDERSLDNAARLAEHVKDHQNMMVNRNLIAGSYIAGFGALITALMAIFRK